MKLIELFIRATNKIRVLIIYYILRAFFPSITFRGIPVTLSSFRAFCLDNKDSKITIGRNFAQRDNVVIECKDGGQLFIGNNVFFNRGCIITCLKYISIADGCIFGPNVMLFDHDHDYNKNSISKTRFLKSSISIGENTWIGASSVILRGTKIGSNCIIGAGSIIKGIIPDNTIVTTKRTLSINNIKDDE